MEPEVRHTESQNSPQVFIRVLIRVLVGFEAQDLKL